MLFIYILGSRALTRSGKKKNWWGEKAILVAFGRSRPQKELCRRPLAREGRSMLVPRVRIQIDHLVGYDFPPLLSVPPLILLLKELSREVMVCVTVSSFVGKNRRNGL